MSNSTRWPLRCTGAAIGSCILVDDYRVAAQWSQSLGFKGNQSRYSGGSVARIEHKAKPAHELQSKPNRDAHIQVPRVRDVEGSIHPRAPGSRRQSRCDSSALHRKPIAACLQISVAGYFRRLGSIA